jgi:hypothetical protein
MAPRAACTISRRHRPFDAQGRQECLCYLGALFGWIVGPGGVGGHGLVDFEVGHFEFAGEIEEQAAFFGSEIALGFFVKRVEHVNELAGGFGIDDGLAGARIGVRAEDHGGVAAKHADEIFKSWQFLRSFSGSLASRRSGWFRRLGSFTDGLARFLFQCFFAEFALRGKRAAVDHFEAFVVFLVRQG